jgi:hypothetical protein
VVHRKQTGIEGFPLVEGGANNPSKSQSEYSGSCRRLRQMVSGIVFGVAPDVEALLYG